jgi:Ser/Thr protein kinase RdoA (MazF antagonist)
MQTRDRQPWFCFEGRLVEMECYVAHHAGMDSWERLATGLSVLGHIHTVLRDLQGGDAGKSPRFANYIEATDALARTLRGIRRIRSWKASPFARQLAADAEELAGLVSSAERAFIGQLPRQLVHGDFWDNNVFFRGDRVVFVADFDFMGKRARIDDLALTFYFTCMKFLEEPVSDDQLRRLSRLIGAYEAGSDTPLTPIERAALPLAIARQPLWSIGGWVASLDDEGAARRHAAGTTAAVAWALRLMREVRRWQAALT